MNHLSTSQLALVAEIQKRHLRNHLQYSDHPQERPVMVATLKKHSGIRRLFSAIINLRRKRQSATTDVPSPVNQ